MEFRETFLKKIRNEFLQQSGEELLREYRRKFLEESQELWKEPLKQYQYIFFFTAIFEGIADTESPRFL